MFNLYTYSLPFREPFVSASGTFSDRKGAILRHRSNAADLVSEAAPLPGFSTESLDMVIRALRQNSRLIDEFLENQYDLNELKLFLESLPGLPSLQFAVSCIGLGLLSKRRKAPLTDLLNREESPEWIRKNAVIGQSDPDSFRRQAIGYIESGFKVLKCKASANPGHLPATLKEIKADYPEVLFRLDANQSWPAENIEELSEQFAGLPVQYIEEPSESSSIPDFMEIARRSIFPVAADESVTRFGLESWVHSEITPPYLVIKPMLLGNLMNLSATIGGRDHLEYRVIFTSSLESAVGRKLIATFAGLYGSKEDAHGLHTGHLFSSDLFSTQEPAAEHSGPATVNSGDTTISYNEIDHTKLYKIF